MTEAELLASVRAMCAWYDLPMYHTYDSRRSEPGFPDLVIVGKRVLFRELKSQTGGLAPLQMMWVNRLVTAGADVAIWRPEDWPGVIAAQLAGIRHA